MAYQRKRCDPGECGRLDYESRIAELLRLVWQYRDDLRHPPAPDSRQRRLEAIQQTLDKFPEEPAP